MPSKVDYIKGEKVGNCFFVSDAPSYESPKGKKRRMGRFKCMCGEEFVSMIENVVKNKVRSCGCIKKAGLRVKHGGSVDQIKSGYNSWLSLRLRCRDKRCKEYPKYGGKGITVSDDWFNSFENFIRDVGPRPSPYHTVDRFPNKKGNYERGNCRWATAKEQANNTSKNLLVDFQGEIKTFSEWSDIYRFNYKTGHRRFSVDKMNMQGVIELGFVDRINKYLKS